MRHFFLFVALALAVCQALDAQLIRKRVPASAFETVTIAYTANTRGLYTEGQTEASASAFQSMIAGVRREYKDVLLLDLGNFIGPAPTSILSEGRFDVARVPSRRPGATQLTSVSGAKATAMHRVK